ncbi:putative GNAT family N-acetyltransferase [Xylariaceae sp. FL0255]|nr:putative GNAT family N-acetyltransferase [Xylariaceae sp. FL0255]
MMPPPHKLVNLPPHYTLRPGLPSATDYLKVRVASGMSVKTAEQAAAVVRGSWYGCHIIFTDTSPADKSYASSTETVIGVGRIISDGGWYFHIADIGVMLEHQRKGLGSAIFGDLLQYIEDNAAEGQPTVNLMATTNGRALYERHGFYDTTQDDMVGMKMRKGLLRPETWKG